MNTQADWWLLLVGLILGAGLTYLILAEFRRRDDDLAADEQQNEAAWIVGMLAAEGTEADSAGILEVLRLHRLYLASIPSDEPAWAAGDPDWPMATYSEEDPTMEPEGDRTQDPERSPEASERADASPFANG
jgi:hypothetical protein